MVLSTDDDAMPISIPSLYTVHFILIAFNEDDVNDVVDDDDDIDVASTRLLYVYSDRDGGPTIDTTGTDDDSTVTNFDPTLMPPCDDDNDAYNDDDDGDYT